jgi:uncharacterized membrane protein YdbT with pleckstrin-like domain
VGYPERLLSEGEEIVRQFRPHWSRLIREGALVVLGLILAVLIGITDLLAPSIAGLVVLTVFLLIVGGVIRWLTTMHVISNERVIYRAGWIAKRGKEIPLEVINDVAFSQTVFERLFRTGDLLIESAGTHGQTRYSDIPEPEGVQSTIYEAREARMVALRRMSGAPAPAESRASQLEALARLHDDGKLTDEEFQTEKNRLLGDS